LSSNYDHYVTDPVLIYWFSIIYT